MISQGGHRADQTIGQCIAQSSLRHSPKQESSSPNPPSAEFFWYMHDQENAVFSCLKTRFGRPTRSSTLSFSKDKHDTLTLRSLLGKLNLLSGAVVSVIVPVQLVWSAYKNLVHLISHRLSRRCDGGITRCTYGGPHVGQVPWGDHDRRIKFWLTELVKTSWPV